MSNKLEKKSRKKATLFKKNNVAKTLNFSKTQVVYDNTTEDIIMINESKARLIYKEHMHNNVDIGNILALIGMAITCLLAFLSSDFEKFSNCELITPTLLSGIFFIIFILASVAAMKLSWRFLCNKGKYTDETFILSLKTSDGPQIIEPLNNDEE